MSDSLPAGSLEPAGHLRRRVASAGEWPHVEAAWRQVFEASDQRSFFMGPDWVGAWLDTFGQRLQPELVLYEAGDVPVAVALLVDRPRALPRVPLRRIYFHTAGEPPIDSPVAENICLIARADIRPQVVALVVDWLRGRPWDELVLSGVTESTLDELGATLDHGQPRVEWRPTYWVDLAGLRSRTEPYESVLSANARSQLRRTLKLYAERGHVELRPSRSAAEAHALFDDLVALNARRYQQEGTGSVFDSDTWRSFHRRLIDRAFAAGAIHISAATAGGQTFGILYNVADRGTVSFYQSAFAYEPDNRLKPGQLAHALAIQQLIDGGFDRYDLLAADGPEGSRYKASLATHTGRLAWAVLRRATLRGAIVDGVRRARRRR